MLEHLMADVSEATSRTLDSSHSHCGPGNISPFPPLHLFLIVFRVEKGKCGRERARLLIVEADI